MDTFTKIPGNKAVPYMHEELLEAQSKMVIKNNSFPRGNDLSKMTVAERAIYDCMGEVEKVGADVLLTECIVLLQQAKDKLSKYVDSTLNK